MNSAISESITQGSSYFNLDYATGSFLGVLFLTFFLGFTFLFLVWTFNSKNFSSDT